MSAGSGRDARPVLRLVRGVATPEELAAVLAVVMARAAGGPPPPAPAAPASRWSSGAGLRRPLPRGPGAWRAVFLPGAH